MSDTMQNAHFLTFLGIPMFVRTFPDTMELQWEGSRGDAVGVPWRTKALGITRMHGDGTRDTDLFF